MIETIIYLTVFLAGIGIGMFLKEGVISKKKIIWQETRPIIIENEFGERHSYVEYWICEDSKGNYSFHYKGKFAKIHQGYNLAYQRYLDLQNSAKNE